MRERYREERTRRWLERTKYSVKYKLDNLLPIYHQDGRPTVEHDLQVGEKNHRVWQADMREVRSA